MAGARTGNSLPRWRRTISTIRPAGSVAAGRTVATASWTIRAVRRTIRSATHAVTNRGTQFLLGQLAVVVFIERLESRTRVGDFIRVYHAIVIRIQHGHQRGWRGTLTIHAGTALTSRSAGSTGSALAWRRTLTIRRRAALVGLSHEH